MTEQRSTRKVPTLVLVLLPLVIVVLVGLGVYMMVSKPKAPPAAGPSARERAEAASESAESEGPQLLPASEWGTRIAIRHADSPFRPGQPGALESTGEAGEDMSAESVEAQETPPESEDASETPEVEAPEPSVEPPPGRTQPGRGGGRRPDGQIVLPGPSGPPGGVGPTPGPTGPTPPAEVEVVERSREDRTNERMRELFPREMMPGRGPERAGPIVPPELTVTGTVVGRDGGTSAVITDGTSRYFVKQGQTLNLAGRNMRVLSVDRGRVVLEDERGAMTLQANGGAAR